MAGFGWVSDCHEIKDFSRPEKSWITVWVMMSLMKNFGNCFRVEPKARNFMIDYVE